MTTKQVLDANEYQGDTVSGGVAEWRFLTGRHIVSVVLPADAAAGTDTVHTILGDLPYAIKLISANIVPNGTAAANGSNYATASIGWADGAATSPTLFDSLTTASVAMTAETKRDFSGIVETDTVAAGNSLVCDVTKTGTGVALAASCVTVVFEWTG